MSLLALSIRQPWAEAIIAGHKTIETRRWPRCLRAAAEALIGKRIAIHTGKSAEEQDWDYLLWIWHVELSCALPRGAIVGTALLLDTRFLTARDDRDALCDAEGKFGLVFDDPRRLAYPLPCTGRLGFFPVEIPDELLT